MFGLGDWYIVGAVLGSVVVSAVGVVGSLLLQAASRLISMATSSKVATILLFMVGVSFLFFVFI